MDDRTVLISGASVAGPALAYWLRRYGFSVTVVEQAPTLRAGGHAVDVRGAARDVVERMGIMPRVRQDSVDERGVALVDRHGRRTATMPADAFGGEGIVAEIEIMRGDLSRILYDATSGDVEYLFGDRIVELTQHDDRVEVVFASGSARRFDLVVGADGVHSGVRALAFGPESDHVRHLGAYTAYFTVPDPGDLENWFLMYNAPGGRVAMLRPERGGTAKASLGFTSPPLDYDRRDVREQQRILVERMAGAGWRVPELLAAMPDAPDFYFDSICQVRVDRWWRGRVALVGDAGYCGSPLVGLGTSMSLVGAYVLAGELASTPDDHEASFVRYQDEMRDYVAAAMELPPGGVNGYAPQSQLMISLRALSMRMMTRWPMRQILARQFQKSDGIVLKDYAARRLPHHADV
ncbi:FAD-dependent monooxygenase [Micromonospora sp. DR5-3]|uniref:FAD-dependent monooxygenase n=1 Tax=unclassified Micromonospora TaxID=2617518 RepID=UPI0011DAD636|nr:MULTISPECIES: FAD-dependent monooxygenase [unclassified Micromonospora]MCW3819688.1 FAD-dependent monooxygenase [Micromonospora sp. DR5-3]TYC20432.1 FAD-binding monooxygenase [Micromonospora sp. MP36]